MDEAIRTITINSRKIEIFADDTDGLNPRENDNLGTMVCFHGSYDLSDNRKYNRTMFSCWEEFKKHLIKEEKAVVILPLYLYDHSGITMRTTPFSCPWDSGQVGYVYATKKDIIENYGGINLTQKKRDKAEELLIAETKTYDHYITDSCYRYKITDKNGDEIDSCGGFLTDNIDDVITEAKIYAELLSIIPKRK